MTATQLTVFRFATMPHNFLVFRKIMIEKFDEASSNEGGKICTPSRTNGKRKQLLSNEDGKVNSEKSSASKSESDSDRKKQLVSQENEISRLKNPPEP